MAASCMGYVAPAQPSRPSTTPLMISSIGVASGAQAVKANVNAMEVARRTPGRTKRSDKFGNGFACSTATSWAHEPPGACTPGGSV